MDYPGKEQRRPYGWRHFFEQEDLVNDGWWFGFFTNNPVMLMRSHWWPHWNMRSLSYKKRGDTREILGDIFHEAYTRKKYKISSLFLETHSLPDTLGNWDAQVREIEKFDISFKLFLNKVNRLENIPRIIISADHGELMGEKHPVT